MQRRRLESRPEPGDFVTFYEMCDAEGVMLQQGMRFREPPEFGVILMSVRPGAPYEDAVEADGSITYEGHDRPRRAGQPHRKLLDQELTDEQGRLTQNGRFARWTDSVTAGRAVPARFRVYQKLYKGIWTYLGAYELVSYDRVHSDTRSVYKFRLEPRDEVTDVGAPLPRPINISPGRAIPTTVKQAVYKRDRGSCLKCGAKDGLHFDHIIPLSRGGSSTTMENIQLLCARHNLEKSNRID